MNADKDKPSNPNKLKSLKEKIMKAVKEILGEKELEEDMFEKGTGPAATTVLADPNTPATSKLTQKGYRPVPGTKGVQKI